MKYFSDILSTIKHRHRIYALVILSLTVIIVTLGTPLLNDLFKNNKDLKEIIKEQENEINVLSVIVVSLNNEIRLQSMGCTDKILQREIEILDRIQLLISKIDNSSPLRIMSAPDSSQAIKFVSSPTIDVMYELKELEQFIKSY